MENNKEILARAKRLRNINSCIIAELENGRRVEVAPKLIEEKEKWLKFQMARLLKFMTLYLVLQKMGLTLVQ